MSHLKMKTQSALLRMLPVVVAAVTLLLATAAHAAVPGISGPSFNLTAGATSISQPDGEMIYSWGYGCNGAAKLTPFSGNCPSVQIPGPTLIVNEGDIVTVVLTNNLPASVGNTSIVFPGFQVCAGTLANGVCTPNGGVPGLLAQEAAHGGTVTYMFDTAKKAGTHSYYSGTQSDLQIEMGMYGALVVLPATAQSACTPVGNIGGSTDDYRLASSAYDNPSTCYDREYLFQWAELDSRIHRRAEEQVQAAGTCAPSATVSCLSIPTEPYRPNYFLINGRSMPDDMDANYAPNYPNQPYNGNPHMHPGELVLLRVIGQGRWQHPFHEHANHVRILGRDGNLILSQTDPTKLGGRLEFTTDTTPGQAFDGIFYYTGRGLNWDVYGHTPSNAQNPACFPDANGYYTTNSNPAAVHPSYDAGGNMISGAANYYEWCADHNHPMETNPTGQVGHGGMVTPPDPNILANGLWYNGSPYLSPDAVARSMGPTPLPPSGTVVNAPNEAGIAFMWHSHNEREITTNDVFPGGMMMMMLVDPWTWYIDETK